MHENKQKIDDHRLKELRSIFEKYPEILAVYLFGSYASGKVHKESDLDLAIVPDNNTIRQKRLDILQQLTQKGFTNIDLVILDFPDIVLMYEVIRINRLIYKKPDFDHGAFYSKIIRQYFDFYPYLEYQRKAYKRRILIDQTWSHSQTLE